MFNALTTVLAAEGTHHEINHALSWGVGAVILVIMLGLLLALVSFGAGREHS
ncbi:hypothetical protein [Nocardioides sp. zg-DK7169]|uniref:hypothetical protein n=1 Tax=Nocardioides sp. zg-DK7169 TaxID=2736600 RepID=UPI001C1328E8|nr:hypothetical protein [Nocardioides sp. zg-DK7169]